MSRVWWLGVAVALVAACSSAGAATIPVASFTVTSPVMEQGGELPQQYTCDGSSTTASFTATTSPELSSAIRPSSRSIRQTQCVLVPAAPPWKSSVMARRW